MLDNPVSLIINPPHCFNVFLFEDYKCTMSAEDIIDLDQVLNEIGQFGRYQKRVLWLICLPACFPCGFCAFNQLFMTTVPDHWCWIPEFSNVSIEERKSLAIPYDDHYGYSKCERFSANQNESLTKCLNGWEFNTSEVTSSVVISFSLVCDHDIYPTIALVALNAGGPIGVYSFGLLNDHIGRKKSFFICLTIMLIGGVLTAFATHFWLWTFCRFIVGLTIPAVYQIPFIIALELVGPKYRAFVTVMTCTFYTTGLILLTGITYLVRDWQQLALATSLPFLLYYIYWLFLPESPRWLLAKCRKKEALDILKEIAKTNKTVLSANIIHRINNMPQRSIANGDKPNCMLLCSSRNMRLKTCLITMNWFANEMVYVGLSYYGPHLGDDKYISFLLSSVIEVPTYFLCWFLMDHCGRRWPLSASMLICGLCCIAITQLPEDATTPMMVLYLTAKAAISASFLIIYPFAGELYPTALRGIGIGISAYIAGLGLILIPFVTYLGSASHFWPFIIMGVVALIGGGTGLRLPETLHCPLPQTIADGEAFGKDFKWNDYFACNPTSDHRIKRETVLELDEYSFSEEENLNIKRNTSRQNSNPGSIEDSMGIINIAYWF